MNNMSEAERLKLAELVSSRVCESLIGPIGAVVNGLELLRFAEDGSTSAATQTQIDRDCARIIDRLRFFRLAYGCDDDDLPVALSDLRLAPDPAAMVSLAGKCEFRTLLAEYERVVTQVGKPSQAELF